MDEQTTEQVVAPKSNVKVRTSMTLSPDLLAKCKEHADKANLSSSAVMELALKQFFGV